MQVTLLFLRFVYIAKAENVGDKFYLEDTENNCNYNLVALIPVLRDIFYLSQDYSIPICCTLQKHTTRVPHMSHVWEG